MPQPGAGTGILAVSPLDAVRTVSLLLHQDLGPKGLVLAVLLEVSTAIALASPWVA